MFRELMKWFIGGKPAPRADMTYEDIKKIVNEEHVIAEIKLTNGNTLKITPPPENRQMNIRLQHEANAW